MTKKDLRLTRVNPIIQDRQTQIQRNLAALEGGQTYIDLRLSRFPSESDSSWYGSNRTNNLSTLPNKSFSPGRSQRAYNINYAGRVVRKISQYVFGNQIHRDGGDEEFLADVTQSGVSVNEFMKEACAMYIAAGWVWVSADRGAPAVDENGNPLPRTVAGRQAEGERVYWNVWNPLQVVDWHFDGQSGRLMWLITESCYYDSADATVEPVKMTERRYWEYGGSGICWKMADGADEAMKEEFSFAGEEIPFHLIGEASPEAYWYDDAEILQAAILNLLSADHESMLQSVFPQLVMPFGIIESVMEAGKLSYQEALEMVRGLNYPIYEPADAKGTTRFIQPDKNAMATIPERIEQLRKEMFECVGLAMSKNSEGKQAQSAEAKRWDNIEPEMTLKEMAQKMETAEQRLIEFSAQLDSTFASHDVSYPEKFEINDAEELGKALAATMMLSLPPGAQKEQMKLGIKILDSYAGLSDERKAELMQEIDDEPDAMLGLEPGHSI